MTQKENDFDVIVIGAGHNGLVAAATLAKKGKRVCVLERSSAIGGMARSGTMGDGVSAPRIAHLAYNLNSTVLKELGISRAIKLKKLSTIALAPDGKHVEINGSDAHYADGSEHPAAERYRDLRERIQKFADLLAPLALKSPPDMSEGLSFTSALENATLAKLGINLRLMGKKDMREFLRVVLSNIYDLALEDMEDDPLAGSLAADAVLGAWTGPRSPGSVFSLMYRYGEGGDTALPIGGMGAIVEAIAAVAQKNGADIRTNASVKNLVVEQDRVNGVVLEDGSLLSARAVMSSVAAFPSMMIAGVEHFDVEAVRRVRNLRAKGTTAKINFLLRDAPEFTGLTREQSASRLVIAPSALYVERAFNAVKYGEMAQAPVIEAVIPSLSDPSPGGDAPHLLSATVQFIPYLLKAGWNDKERERLAEIVIETLSQYAPGLREKILETDILSPLDIENETGAPGGHWHHGELSTDQLLTVRPVNGMSRYAFGVKGYYLCGAGAHPGGGVSGAAGRNSALQLLKDGALS